MNNYKGNMLKEMFDVFHLAWYNKYTSSALRRNISHHPQLQPLETLRKRGMLTNELEGAWQLLEAAGITVHMESLKEPLPPALDAGLAWTVREGVTNVIHHSRARQCCIRLTHEREMVSVEILNDGGERGPEEKLSRRGLGLAGLRERVSRLEGQLEAGSLLLQGKEYFRLFVELPITKGRATALFREEHA